MGAHPSRGARTPAERATEGTTSVSLYYSTTPSRPPLLTPSFTLPFHLVRTLSVVNRVAQNLSSTPHPPSRATMSQQEHEDTRMGNAEDEEADYGFGEDVHDYDVWVEEESVITDVADAESVATTRAPGDPSSSLVSPFGRTIEAGGAPHGPRGGALDPRAQAAATNPGARTRAVRARRDPDIVLPIRNVKPQHRRTCDSCWKVYHWRNCERNIVPLFQGAWWQGTSHEKYYLLKEDGTERSDVSYTFLCYVCKAIKDGTDEQTALRAIYGKGVEKQIARSMAWSEKQEFIQGVFCFLGEVVDLDEAKRHGLEALVICKHCRRGHPVAIMCDLCGEGLCQGCPNPCMAAAVLSPGSLPADGSIRTEGNGNTEAARPAGQPAGFEARGSGDPSSSLVSPFGRTDDAVGTPPGQAQGVTATAGYLSSSSLVSPFGRTSEAEGVPSGAALTESATAVRPTKRQLRMGMHLQTKLKINILGKCFGPLVEILELKCKDEELQAHAAKRVQRWLNGQTGSPNLEVDMREGFEACEKLDEAAHKFRAFEDKDDPDRWQRAVDYHDEWIPGVVVVSYICRGKGGECRTVIDSKCWDRFLEDPLAKRQRWYCKLCNTRFKTAFGVLIRILHKGVANYVYAELPPMHFYDAKGMLIAKLKPEFTTPEALYDAVPQARPIGNFLAPTHVEGHYTITGFDQLLELQKSHNFDWNQLYRLP